MANCPLCSDILLRHIRSGQTYWFCRRCRLEILEKTDQICYQHSINPQQIEDHSAKKHRHLKPEIEGLQPYITSR